MKKPFNPNDFFDTVTVKDVAEKFPALKEIDFTKESLNDKLVELNYELISSEYEDKKFKNVEDYYDLIVDPVV